MKDLARLKFWRLSLLLGFLFPSSPCLAEGANTVDLLPGAAVAAPVAIVVDVQRILDTSLAAKSVEKQLESQRAKFQTQIETEENELRQAEDDLKARKDLTPDLYTDHEQQLRQRFLAVERRVQARRKSLDQALSSSMNSVHTGLLDIVRTVAHEHHANLALIKQQVLWTDAALDATDEILLRLNTSMPSVTVKPLPDPSLEDAPK